MKDNHTFGCTVFAFQNVLAVGNAIPKWSSRARLRLNLEPSPNHARNVNYSFITDLMTSLKRFTCLLATLKLTLIGSNLLYLSTMMVHLTTLRECQKKVKQLMTIIENAEYKEVSEIEDEENCEDSDGNVL